MVESWRDKLGALLHGGALVCALLAWVAVIVMAAIQEPHHTSTSPHRILEEIILTGRQ